jgi:hypothetical protein
MQRHQASDYALEIKRISSPFSVLANSVQDAARQFQETEIFDAFVSSNIGKNVYIYSIDEKAMPVRIDL